MRRIYYSQLQIEVILNATKSWGCALNQGFPGYYSIFMFSHQNAIMFSEIRIFKQFNNIVTKNIGKIMNKSDLSRNGYMLTGPLPKKGYDWWWHSVMEVCICPKA